MQFLLIFLRSEWHPTLLWPNGWNGWMKTPLGTEVDLRAGHIVLDGFPALRERGTAPLPFLGPCLLWPRSPILATAELLFSVSRRYKSGLSRTDGHLTHRSYQLYTYRYCGNVVNQRSLSRGSMLK